MGLLSFLSPRNHAATAPAQQIMPSGQIRVTTTTVRRSAADKRTDLELQYGTPAYIPGIEDCGTYYRYPQPIEESPELILEIAEGIWAEAEQKAVAEAREAEERDERMLRTEASHLTVGVVLEEALQRRLNAAIDAGDLSGIHVPSQAERHAHRAEIRKVIQQRRRQRFTDTFNTYIRPGVLRFSEKAWAKVRAIEKQEKGGLLHRWGLSYAPSPAMRAVVYVALRSREPITNFEVSPFCALSVDPLEVWGFLLPPKPAVASPDRLPGYRPPSGNPRNLEQENYEERIRREDEERKALLPKINAENDAIRNQPRNEDAVARYRVVRVAPEKPAQPEQSK